MVGVPLNVPLDPDAPVTTLNETAAPCTGTPLASVTVTWSATGNACPSAVDCPSPPDFVRPPGGLPLCVTVTCWPRMVIFATRAATDVLARNEKLMNPPETPAMVSHG